MYQVVAAEGAHVDVVSGGELYTAIKAGFPMANVSFHGIINHGKNWKWQLTITWEQS